VSIGEQLLNKEKLIDTWKLVYLEKYWTVNNHNLIRDNFYINNYINKKQDINNISILSKNIKNSKKYGSVNDAINFIVFIDKNIINKKEPYTYILFLLEVVKLKKKRNKNKWEMRLI
jgi:hypothetical protein